MPNGPRCCAAWTGSRPASVIEPNKEIRHADNPRRTLRRPHDRQKAELAKELTAACVRVLSGSPDGVDVLFFDIARQDWATGGVLWSEKKPAG